MFPIVDVEGDARSRGRQYGEAAFPVGAYEEVFAHYTGWSREAVREYAEGFRAPIAEFGAKYLEEITGIAEGADADPSDVLAINVRTEIMFAAESRRLAGEGELPAECSSFAVQATRAGGSLLVGQNWDWLEHAAETTIVLRSRQDGGPSFLTVVEAGLLAKVGLNAAGVAVATNMLVSDSDRGAAGIPYHLLLRALFDAPSLPRALATLQSGSRSSSANYLIAGDEVALDVEAFPGGHGNLYLTYPDADLLLHFNHFRHPDHRSHDLTVPLSPSSPLRQVRIEQLIRDAGGPLDLEFWQRALGDHAMFPDGVCHHPDPEVTNPPERAATVASLVMEPASRRVWLAAGYPCSTPFEQLDTSFLRSGDGCNRSATGGGEDSG